MTAAIIDSLSGTWTIGGLRIPRRVIIPAVFAAFVLIGLVLFHPVALHHFPGLHSYSQHLYFDGIADAGGFYASTFCKHWYHRVAIAIGFALATTLVLVMVVG